MDVNQGARPEGAAGEARQGDLESFVCPKDGSDLLFVEDWDGDEGGVYFRPYFKCRERGHEWAARSNGVGDYYAADWDD